MSIQRIGSMLPKQQQQQQRVLWKCVLRQGVGAGQRGKHTGPGKGAGPHWSAHDLTALRDAASSFSSLSPVLGKSHAKEHTHSLFSAHTHTHDSRELARKMEMLEHNQAGSRITLIGMGANIGMSAAKGAAGVVFHSSALLADAAHSLSDIVGDLVTLYTFRKSRRPADATHPFGYGRYEALGTLVVSAFLVTAGAGIGMHALEQIVHYLPDVFAAGSSAQELATSGHSMFGHSHAAAHEVVDGSVVVDPRAIWFAAGSIVINEALFQATMKVGKRTQSNVLVANAWHHRSDALTSLVSVGAIAGAIMGFPVLDAVGGLVVSTMLAKSGLSMMADAANEVTDTPPPPHYAAEVAKELGEIIRSVGAVQGFSDVQCRKSGPFIHVRVGLQFAAGASAADIVRAIASVRQALREKLSFVRDFDVEVVIK
ncbi:mitochondrial metal transporter [Coemansia erecta]|nr:mitochondrial metal transporter [Coemansia erecta]